MVAYSGGPDSMALLHALYELRERLSCRLHIAHLHHGMRGEEAARDAREALSKGWELGVPVSIKYVEVPRMAEVWGVGEEVAGRRARYDFLTEVCRARGATRLATGHNLNDQAETVLLNLFRGAGLDGLAGIPAVRDLTEGVKVIRPLLEVSRQEIEEFCRAMGLKPIIDRTNIEADYARNRLRQRLLPVIKEEFGPTALEVLSRLAAQVRDELGVLEGMAEEAASQIIREAGEGRVVLDRATLASQPRAIARRVVRAVLRRMRGGLEGFTFSHVEAVLALVGSAEGSRECRLPFGIVVRREYELITFLRRPSRQIPEPKRVLPVPGEAPWGKAGVVRARVLSREELPPDWREYCTQRAYIDLTAVTRPLYLRSRRPGDTFHPLGAPGRKKLKDFFIDEKVPAARRDMVPLVVDEEGKIVWVVGHRIDDSVRVLEHTWAILELSYVNCQRGLKYDTIKQRPHRSKAR